MTRATRSNEYTGKTSHLYLSFELGVDEWKLGFSIDLGPSRGFESCRRGM